MNIEISRDKTPEEKELQKKLLELNEFETELAQSELDLATLQAELHSFESIYLHTVGVRLAEFDEIVAQIAEAEACLKPKDNRRWEKAAQARAEAQESQEATELNNKIKKEKFKPSEDLKKLYREIAKHIHPDLAVDGEERIRRHELMAEVNSAYEKGDEIKLRAILDEWESSPESIKGEGTAAELIRVIRKIAQVEKRLHSIESEISQLEESDLYQLKIKVEKAEDEGRDLLAEMTSRVDEQIALANGRLNEITGESVHT